MISARQHVVTSRAVDSTVQKSHRIYDPGKRKLSPSSIAKQLVPVASSCSMATTSSRLHKMIGPSGGASDSPLPLIMGEGLPVDAFCRLASVAR